MKTLQVLTSQAKRSLANTQKSNGKIIIYSPGYSPGAGSCTCL